MTAVSLGDLARTFMLRRQNVALKSQAQRLSTETVTGLTADVRKKVKGDLGSINGIDSSLALLAARKSVTSEATLLASGMQNVLSAMNKSASDLALDLTSLSPNGMKMTTDQLGTAAEDAFRSAISALNTRIGDRSIFAGNDPQSAAVADADVILASLETAIAGAASAADVEQAVFAWFNNAGGYAAMSCQAAPLAPIAVSATENVKLQVTAQHSVIKETLKGLALAAMLNRGALSGSDAGRTSLAESAGARLLQGQTDRIDLAARIGLVEERIEAAATANAAETTSLQIARIELLGVDSYETATQLEATQTQIETLYKLTTRLSRMSLVDYL
ncbi:flagellar biosynthesis protein FlgL [Cereibacter sphaeroides]|uniref:flagellin n=1 Tax=Cereibacter sphaeroides TaxID=1063 RepID=UPI001F32F06C|nr:flagellin [Cereibacter sphaeroides]MCE6960950.1 flagellar biosynthesis protein FlgL [Cereibacter sphaeroides]MCE6969752.1 flagellar biosynthesis protein FlgL [Cereibacter sphaeroides]MCE6975227.1 flagellar biosynthesis protein FlgL [Cereibacter sphaeroides]